MKLSEMNSITLSKMCNLDIRPWAKSWEFRGTGIFLELTYYVLKVNPDDLMREDRERTLYAVDFDDIYVLLMQRVSLNKGEEEDMVICVAGVDDTSYKFGVKIKKDAYTLEDVSKDFVRKSLCSAIGESLFNDSETIKQELVDKLISN